MKLLYLILFFLCAVSLVQRSTSLPGTPGKGPVVASTRGIKQSSDEMSYLLVTDTAGNVNMVRPGNQHDDTAAWPRTPRKPFLKVHGNVKPQMGAMAAANGVEDWVYQVAYASVKKYKFTVSEFNYIEVASFTFISSPFGASIMPSTYSLRVGEDVKFTVMPGSTANLGRNIVLDTMGAAFGTWDGNGLTTLISPIEEWDSNS